MTPAGDWLRAFRHLTAYLRARGHLWAFVLQGRSLRAPGMTAGLPAFRPAND